MTMPIIKISLEWRFLENSDAAGHMALVAREEGQSNEEGFVISANPSLYGTDELDELAGNYGYLQTNKGNSAGSTLDQTVDAYPLDENGVSLITEDDRNSKDITEALMAAGNGRSLDEIWADMVALANQIDAAQFEYDPADGAPPVGIPLNSNSLIVSILASFGIDAAQYLIGDLPSPLGFPGDSTILSGSGSDFMRGFGDSDTFLDTGGNDVFHGGGGETLVRSDASDGIDTVFYERSDGIRVNSAPDLSSWMVNQKVGTEEFIDTLYSIEGFGSKSFTVQNILDLGNEQEGKTLRQPPFRSPPAIGTFPAL